MKLVVTIDTEEDNWQPYSRTIRTRNAREIARVHDLFLSEGVRPTYLATWPMARDDGLVDTLAGENRMGRCEIGAHCHPWTTPPFGETQTPSNTMLCNLSREQIEPKLKALHELLHERFGTPPVTFRAGRWGFGPKVAAVIESLGYRVDTSVTAYTDWSPQHGPDYSLMGPTPYRFTPDRILRPVDNGTLVELPATSGFLQQDFAWHARFDRTLRRRSVRWLRLSGALDRLYLHNRVTLSPECATTRAMTALMDRLHAQGYGYLNLYFHSPTLVPGLTPFVTCRKDLDAFLNRLRDVIRHAMRLGAVASLARDAVEPAAPLDDLDAFCARRAANAN